MEDKEHQKEKRSQRDYPMGFKLEVISQVEKGKMTYKQAQKHYGIQGRSTVLVWLRKHGNLDWSNSSRLKFMSKSEETPAQKIKRLEKELKKELMKYEFDLNMALKDKEGEAFNNKEKYKEDRKDERTRIQASQQSQLIEQRKDKKGEQTFESAGNDTMGSGFNLEAFEPR